MQGPSDTPFEGGTFELAISVPEQYPLVAPAGTAVKLQCKEICPASVCRKKSG